MFNVYENNKPCSVEGYPWMDPSWKTHSFPTFVQALEWARLWLGEHAFGIPNGWSGELYDYSGYGDMIEIREEL